jgi:hypothetical protein
MKHPFDFRLDNRGARHRRQQDATQGIAQCVAETTLERLDRDSGTIVAEGLHFNGARAQKFGS